MRYRVFLFFILSTCLFSKEEGFINPITDVCWECLFPITVSGVNVTPQYKDFTKYNQAFCFCSGTPPKAGIPLTFWEPSRLVDVTRHEYRLIGLGGISVGKETIKNRGSIGVTEDGGMQNSFYHVHWYFFPLLNMLEIFTDFDFTEKGELDIAYLSEFDPRWNDDQWSFIISAEAALFSSPIAQLACIADGTAANLNKPIDKLFWCAECHGSLYPFLLTWFSSNNFVHVKDKKSFSLYNCIISSRFLRYACLRISVSGSC